AAVSAVSHLESGDGGGSPPGDVSPDPPVAADVPASPAGGAVGLFHRSQRISHGPAVGRPAAAARGAGRGGSAGDSGARGGRRSRRTPGGAPRAGAAAVRRPRGAAA